MAERDLVKEMDAWIRMGNRIHAAAKAKYGPEAQLTHEADGSVFIMEKDPYEKQVRSHTWGKESANEIPKWVAIAW